MRAVFIVPNLTSGGVQTQVLQLARTFKNEMGFQVVVCGLLNKDDHFIQLLRDESIRYYFKPDLGELIWNYQSLGIFKKSLTWMKVWFFLLKQGRGILLPYTKRVDTFFNTIWRFTLLRKSFSFERGGHTKPVPNNKSFLNWLRKASQPIYVSNSQHGREAMSIIKEVPLESIHVIRNGYERLRNSKGEIPEFILKECGACTIVTMVANFFPEKDHLFVVECWAQMPLEIRSKTKLLFAGKGGGVICQQNFDLARKKVNELGLAQEVYFLGSVSYLKELLDVSDIGLLASKTEGCPNAILEYMGAGLPVLGANIPGISEIIPPDNQSTLFEKGDHSDFLAKYLHLFQNPDLRKVIGERNKEYVFEEFSIEKMAMAYKQILLDLGLKGGVLIEKGDA